MNIRNDLSSRILLIAVLVLLCHEVITNSLLNVLFLHLASILSKIRPDIVLLPEGLGLSRRLRRAPTVAPRSLVLWGT